VAAREGCDRSVECGFREIAAVLERPKLARVLMVDRRSEILDLLAAAALSGGGTEILPNCRNAKDNKYFELALAAHAVAIVSSDEDLLALDPCHDIRVLRPAWVLEEIRAGRL